MASPMHHDAGIGANLPVSRVAANVVAERSIHIDVSRYLSLRAELQLPPRTLQIGVEGHVTIVGVAFHVNRFRANVDSLVGWGANPNIMVCGLRKLTNKPCTTCTVQGLNAFQCTAKA